MSAKVDPAPEVESARVQSTGVTSTSSTPINSPKISKFGAKSGFVIPKNKLLGSLVPTVRGGKKLGTSDVAKEDGTKPEQRKTKWGPDLTQDPAVRRGRALAYQTRLDQITLQLNSGILETEDDQVSLLATSTSYQEASFHHINKEKLELLELEKREAIGEVLKLNPSYKAPPDYKPLLKDAKVPIPLKEYPAFNFIGLIFGPGGDTQKRLEKETGVKIRVYGTTTKAEKEEKVEITISDGIEIQGVHEELYVHVSADTYEKIDAAVALIELLLTSVSGKPAAVSPTSISEDKSPDAAAVTSMIATTTIQGVPQPMMGPPRPSHQGPFMPYLGPWLRPPPGFILPRNSSGPILNPSNNMPSLFGPRPPVPLSFNSVPQNPPLVSPGPRAPPLPMQVSNRPYMPHGPPPGQPGPQAFTLNQPISGPRNMAPMAPPMAPWMGPPQLAGPPLSSTPMSCPIPVPLFTSPPAQPGPTTQSSSAAQPLMPRTPVLNSPNSNPGNISSFTPIKPPSLSSGNFTFQPQGPQNPTSQTVLRPSNQPPPGLVVQPSQPPPFRALIRVSPPQPPTIQVLPRLPFGNQPQASPVPFPRNSNPISPFPNPGPPQTGPRNMGLAPYRTRPGMPLQFQQNHRGPPPRPGSLGPTSGGNQIYDPFSPTSAPRVAQQQGDNSNVARKPENDPEYEDLMASVGVR